MRNVVVETILFSSFEPHPTKSNLSSIRLPIWMKQFHGLQILIFNHDQERLVMSTLCLRESHNHDFKKRPSGSSQPAKTWVSNSAKDTTSHGLVTPEGRKLFFKLKQLRQVLVEHVHAAQSYFDGNDF